MEIAAVIRAVVQNFQIVLFVIAAIVTVFKLRGSAAHHVVATPVYTLWGEMLFYTVGFGFLWAFYFHAFAQHIAAAEIGWTPSPFEWELAWAELGIAVIALLSLYRGYEMRLAVTLVFSIFAFGAAGQHINQILCCRNYTPGNAGLILWFGDIALPLFLLVLALMSRDAYERTGR